MKTPPFLILATLVFWGWQSNLLAYGALAGVLLESSRVVKYRWELEDVDFNRIVSLCMLIVVVAAVYVFSNNDNGNGFSALFQGSAGLRNASSSSLITIGCFFRWLPLTTFPIYIAQVYNARSTIPLTALSLVLRLRRRRGEISLAGRYLEISHAYFMVAILSAGFHTNAGTYSYFWGQAVLILWALWDQRPARYGYKVWAAGLLAVVLVGGVAGMGINSLNRLVQTMEARLFASFFHPNTDPLQSATSIGQLGELKLSSSIVIRLQPEAAGVVPIYLREASYREYNSLGRSWRAGEAGNDFHQLLPEPDYTTWQLVANKTGTATINIACYLNGRSQNGEPKGILPLPSGCCRLASLPYAVELETNRTGVALGTGYGLMIFDARYGPGATFDSVADTSTSTNNLDLKVPDNETNALNQVISEMHLKDSGDFNKRLAVQSFFAQNFSYSTWQRPPRQKQDTNTAITRFLLTTRTGHCEFFATATVLLMRKLGIPARYAVGYAVHEASGAGYVVRERDAHAWCLVWNRETKTWEDFDTTPGSWVAIEGRNASWLEKLSDMRSWLVFQFERVRWRQTDLRRYILWSFIPVMLVLLYFIVFQRRAKTRANRKKDGAETPVIWPGHDSAFYRLEKPLAERGVPRQPQELLSHWLERVLAEPALSELRPAVRDLLQLHYRYRFDPNGLTGAEKDLLVQQTSVLLDQLARLKQAAKTA